MRSELSFRATAITSKQLALQFGHISIGLRITFGSSLKTNASVVKVSGHTSTQTQLIHYDTQIIIIVFVILLECLEYRNVHESSEDSKNEVFCSRMATLINGGKDAAVGQYPHMV